MPEEYRALLTNRAWYQDHARQDPVATIRKVRCPVLILQGAMDFQVSAELDAKPLHAALTEAKHPDHELHVFPRLDHLFKRVAGERSDARGVLHRPPDRPGVPGGPDGLAGGAIARRLSRAYWW